MVSRFALAALFISLVSACAPTKDKPTLAQESARKSQLDKATSAGEAADAMTPAELAEAMGVPQDLSEKEELMTKVAGTPLVLVEVWRDGQQMQVTTPTDSWSGYVSTGRKGYATPAGCHRAKFLSKHHRSSRYQNAPMPHAVFFNGHIALHGTYEEKSLGRRASHGCVRLSRANARRVYETVSYYGVSRTRVCVY